MIAQLCAMSSILTVAEGQKAVVTALKERWRWVVVIAFLQVTLLVSLATAQTDSEFKNGWESSDFGPVINVATPTNNWQQEDADRETASDAKPFVGNGQSAGNAESNVEEFSLTEYF